MSEPDLTVQTPGELEGVNVDRIAGIAGGTVDDVLEAIDGLSEAELEQLHLVEEAGKGRKGALGAIDAELLRRRKGEPPEVLDVKIPRIAGDSTDYRNQPGSAVDPDTISRPVLTRDGWVIPTNRGE